MASITAAPVFASGNPVGDRAAEPDLPLQHRRHRNRDTRPPHLARRSMREWWHRRSRYAGSQPQNSKNPKSVSQYDVACFHASNH